jgi:hypothetical protein
MLITALFTTAKTQKQDTLSVGKWINYDTSRECKDTEEF